jgi:hypothetical protein
MSAILTSVYCIPCIWSLVILLATGGACSFVLNNWVPFKGPLPSDGQVEGFASKAARIEFYDTTPMRIRMATKIGISGAVLWAVGTVVAYLILSNLGGAA